MIKKYNRLANVGVLVVVASLVASLLVSGILSGQEPVNIWESDNPLSIAAGLGITFGWFFALWAYAKSKGRSGLWVLCGLLSFIGLLILLTLNDKSDSATLLPQHSH